MNMKSTVFKNEIQTNITALEKNSKEAIENVVAELLSTKIELEQQSAEDLQMLKETLITKDTDITNEFQTDINDLELRSKESYIENLEAELNITHTHLEQKTVEAIQNLEKSMKIKDNEDLKFEIQNSINDLEQLSKEAIENVGEEIENIKTQLENQKPSLNMQEPIPTICKYISYKNLTDKTRRHDFFNSSGNICDMDNTSGFGCTKSFDWQGRG